ncbi:ParB N-terminal domain-containing protein [Sphingomonas sp. BT-65]|uniref:ParB/RepB/Spo0J family partition protein n=1 Tax=Sphingomonas sp. BT-65 TaxID=2989821 RepID=UPI002236BC38|nr:ParB N-terminal domain-containing protein [Sphingomonas sp. BT-65]MCW4460794.1 ParB N-terminal domain-containing protein [Sphingomonas sp. BT-65]
MTKIVQIETTAAEPVSGVEIFVPLNKLKKSPKNARKVPHGEAAIEALAASIQHKGMIQNLVVEPETKDGEPTGCYFVTAGEGRRLAQLLRAKRKQIKRTQPIRCYLDTENDAAEISLDENVTRTPMHPADQFERFHELSRDKGWGAEEIGARFGVSPEIVKRRLRLGAVSPKLMEIYRQDGLTLDQLAAFAITDDHARQEQVFEKLSYNKEPWIIRRDLTADKVPADDRRAVFIGADAYIEAGGSIIRDLFTDDAGGFFEDAALLDTLVIERLREIAGDVLAEGWKWADASIDFPHDHGLRRYYPQSVPLSDEDEARLSEAAAEHDALTEGYSSYDEMPEDERGKAQALLAEIEAISAKRSAFDPEVVARGGVFVSLNSQGRVRVEAGFVRAEDEPQPEPQPEAENAEGVEPEDDGDGNGLEPEDEDEVAGKPLPDSLIRDLTAHRTLGLRLALGEQPEVAMVALTHAMVTQVFYRGYGRSCLDIAAKSEALGGHAEGIADTNAAEALAERHDRFGAQLPTEAADLFGHIAGLDADERTALLAHCVSLTVNAVKVPWERSTANVAAGDVLAGALDLDMTAHWTPTARSYFGRITKAQIAEAVSEAVSPEAAERILPMKKPDMAEAAEQLVAATGWLPEALRTVPPVAAAPEQAPETEEREAPEMAVAAE